MQNSREYFEPVWFLITNFFTPSYAWNFCVEMDDRLAVNKAHDL
jgi:hypothetical protein